MAGTPYRDKSNGQFSSKGAGGGGGRSSGGGDGFKGSDDNAVPSSNRALGGSGNGGTEEFKRRRAAAYSNEAYASGNAGKGMSQLPSLKPDPVADARIRTQAAERQAREAARSERGIQDAVNRSANAEKFNNPGNNRSAGSRGYGA